MALYHSIRMASGLAVTAYCKAKHTMRVLNPWMYTDNDQPSRVDDRLFEQAYHCFMAIYPPLSDLHSPLLKGSACMDPLGMCPVCAEQPHNVAASAADMAFDSAAQAISSDADAHALDLPVGTPSPSPSSQPAPCMEANIPAVASTSAVQKCIQLIHVARDCNTAAALLTLAHDTTGKPSSEVVHGVQPVQRPLAVMADGNQKLTHHANCGTTVTRAHTHAGLPRSSNKYFADLDATLPEQLLLHSAHKQQQRPADNEPDDACGANLSCAREEAYAGVKALDVKCVVGMCCMHGIPAVGMYLSCSTPEQFVYYDILLEELLAKRPDMRAFVLDINCQYKKHFMKLQPELASGLQFWIGWLHSKAGHNLSCQLENSALYANQLGRVIGENMEHVWVCFSVLEVTLLTSMHGMLVSETIPCLHVGSHQASRQNHTVHVVATSAACS
jgi:hypothetical protein